MGSVVILTCPNFVKTPIGMPSVLVTSMLTLVPTGSTAPYLGYSFSVWFFSPHDVPEGPVYDTTGLFEFGIVPLTVASTLITRGTDGGDGYFSTTLFTVSLAFKTR